MDIERRILDGSQIEVRKATADAKTMTIRGYAAKFNSLSENLGGFREQIAPGAFDGVMDNDVRAFINHNPNMIIGRTQAGTLRIFQDAAGLGYEVDLPDTQAARDLMTSIARGDVSQSSFGFKVAAKGDSFDLNKDGMVIRTISKIERLYDVSPVSIPAYPDATVAARSFGDWKNAQEAEKSRELAAKQVQNKRFLAQRARDLRLFELNA